MGSSEPFGFGEEVNIWILSPGGGKRALRIPIDPAERGEPEIKVDHLDTFGDSGSLRPGDHVVGQELETENVYRCTVVKNSVAEVTIRVDWGSRRRDVDPFRPDEKLNDWAGKAKTND